MEINEKTILPSTLPLNADETCLVDRLVSAVRSFLLMSAYKAECFYTTREEIKKRKPLEEWWLDSEESEDEEEPKERFIEKHYVALPSIIYSHSENPNHKLHINCLVNPPLEEHEKKKLKFQEDVLISIDK